MGALFPRFNALVAKADEVNLRSVYHAASQLASALVFPIAFTLALFSYEVLSLWTRNEMVADRSSSIATVLVLGTCLNCVMFVPYNLQLAFGWTRLGLSITVTFLVTLVPASIVLATRYGPIGVASVWLVLNVLYFAVGPYLTHRRVLQGAAPVWYLRDVFPPMLAALEFADAIENFQSDVSFCLSHRIPQSDA
jgi:O-antigen/teichoic acid export membrane protein